MKADQTEFRQLFGGQKFPDGAFNYGYYLADVVGIGFIVVVVVVVESFLRISPLKSLRERGAN